MMRMISGICALGMLAGTYFVCPAGLKDQLNTAMTPSEETLAEMQAGFDALADHFKGPGDMHPELRHASPARG